VCFEEKYSEVNCLQVAECVSVLFVHHAAQAQCCLRNWGQMAQQLEQLCRKSTSIENESFKAVLEMAVLVLWKIYCAGWKAKKQM
jgi:hypothetical protein